MIGAKVAVDADRLACRPASELDFVAPQRVRFHHQGGRRRPRLRRHQGAVLSRRRRPHRAQRGARRSCTTWTNCRSSRRSTSATSRSRIISAAICCTPIISFYTGRGCKSRCTFCLWPQTVGGHAYRMRSVGHVIDELKWAKQAFPQVKEFFFDDDTLTDNLPRVEELAREIGKLGITWSCNAKGNVPRKTLEDAARTTACGCSLVGYESGNQQILHNIKKGMRSTSPAASPRTATSSASSSTAPSSSACRARPRRPSRRPSASPPRSIRTPSRCRSRRRIPARSCYKQATENGWFATNNADLVDDNRHPDRAAQLSASEPHRDFQLGRGVLQAVLFPRAEDRRHRRRDAALAADDEAPLARGRRVLPVPASSATRRRL